MRSPLPVTAVLSLCAVLPAPAQGGIDYDDVTSSAGIQGSGPTFGAGSWTDFDGDRWPDLWVGNHARTPQLWHNQGDGTFLDLVPQVWSGLPGADAHGAMWADFDHDGDPDLLEMVGAESGTGSGPNQLWRNESGILVNQASALGLDYPTGRGRMPLWYDRDGDGWLDLVLANLYRTGTSLALPFRQDVGAPFALDTPASGFVPLQRDVSFTQLADLDGDGRLELLVHGSESPLAIYSFGDGVLQDVTTQIGLPPTFHVRDVVAGDFDGDGSTDLYLARAQDSRALEAALADPQTAIARLGVMGNEIGFRLEGGGIVQMDLPQNWPLSKVHLGATGWRPGSVPVTLDPANSALHGIAAHTPGVSDGLWVGYDLALDSWFFFLSSPGSNATGVRARGALPFLEIEELGFDSTQEAPDRLLLQTAGGWIDGAVDVPIAGRSVVAGDFDNDADLDLYVVRSGPAVNRPNVLYENQNGTFVTLAGGGGAAGSLLGSGDSVSAADFDQDGFLDLFLTHGEGAAFFSEFGPLQLLRNRGNGNHWIEIDLEGVADNRPGIGAWIEISAGGVVQRRAADGGVHRLSQNHARVHFGLGAITVIDRLEVRWRNGEVQRLFDLPADQLVHLLQASEPGILGRPQQVAEGTVLRAWKRSFDGPYVLAFDGGSTSEIECRLIANGAIRSLPVTAFGTQFTWDPGPYGFHLLASPGQGPGRVVVQAAPEVTSLAVLLTVDGVASPRQLAFGRQASHPAPAGWILDQADRLGAGTSAPGLNLWSPLASPQQLVLSSTGSSPQGNALAFDLLGDADFAGVTTSGLEAEDQWQWLAPNQLHADGFAGLDNDRYDVDLGAAQWLALLPCQDSLFQPHRVHASGLIQPNAYRLPRASPLGEPTINPASDGGFFLWLDPATGDWVFEGVGGGQGRTFGGWIQAEADVLTSQGIGLEAGDSFSTADPRRIRFDLSQSGSDRDRIILGFPPQTRLELMFDPGSGQAGEVRVGEVRWPVDRLPLQLVGW